MKAHYKDSLDVYYKKISEVKSNLLLMQSCLMDEEGYTDEMDEMFDLIDTALEDAKEKIESLKEEM